MPRLVFHIEEYDNWSFFIGHNGYSFSVFGKQQINPQTIFNSKFYNINELVDYLEEVMNFQPNKTNFRITLFKLFIISKYVQHFFSTLMIYRMRID